MSNVSLGAAAVAFGAASAIAGVVIAALGAAGRRPGWFREVRLLAWVMLGAATAAVIVMERALITRDFTVGFVAQHGSSQTPALFNVATLWSALEGSILLWTLVLCGYVVAVVVKFGQRGADPMLAWAMLTLFVVSGLVLVPGPTIGRWPFGIFVLVLFSMVVLAVALWRIFRPLEPGELSADWN